MKKFILVIVAILLLLTSCAPNTGGGITYIDDFDLYDPYVGINKNVVLDYIVKDNKSDYVIVIGENYTKTDYFAATEMQNFIYQSTGISLQVSNEITVNFEADSKVISIGKTNLFNSLNYYVDYNELGDGGFILKTIGKSLFILGNNDRGTLYGTYDFLEKILGIRFISDDCTHVPQINEIPLYKMGVTETPAFPIRSYSSYIAKQDNLLAARMRFIDNVTKMKDEYGGNLEWDPTWTVSHTSLYYVPTSVYYSTAQQKAENAHMYNIKDDTVLDICFSDGITEDGKIDQTMEISAIKVAIETLKTYVLRNDPDIKYYMFGQMDDTRYNGKGYCNCAKCVEGREKYKDSGIIIRFANLMASEVQKWADEELGGRDINVIVFAYQYSEEPPLNSKGEVLDSTVIPSNNVYVRIAPIYANYYYPINDDIKNFKSKGIIDNWGKLTKNLMLWTYCTHFGSLYSYFPTMHTWQQSFNYYKDEQVKFLYMQSNSTEIADWKARMETYIASKMLWNPNRDVLQLRNEYIDIYYGVASSYIKRFMDSLDEHYCNVFNNYNVYNQCQGSEIIISKYHTAAFFENLINTVEDAEKSVSESSLSSNEKQVLLKRLEQVKITPMYMLLINYDSYYSNSIKKDAFVKKFFEICDRNKIVRFKEGQPYADFKAQYIV